MARRKSPLLVKQEAANKRERKRAMGKVVLMPITEPLVRYEDTPIVTHAGYGRVTVDQMRTLAARDPDKYKAVFLLDHDAPKKRDEKIWPGERRAYEMQRHKYAVRKFGMAQATQIAATRRALRG